jgi:hypothetical protein
MERQKRWRPVGLQRSRGMVRLVQEVLKHRHRRDTTEAQSDELEVWVIAVQYLPDQ